MNWFENFLNDINEQTEENLSPDDLLEKLKKFKETAIRDTPALKCHYIDNFKNWNTDGKREKPLFPGADLLLSFHGEVYPSVKSEIINNINELLHKASSSKTTKTGEIIAKELARRNKRRKGGCFFWDKERNYVQEKYAGYYALFRVTSETQIAVELVALTPNSKHQPLTTLFWGCQNELWVGDLLTNPYKFSGSALRASTNRILEPVTFTTLRTTYRRNTPRGEPNLLLSGLIVGWIDNDRKNILCSKVGLVKIPSSPDGSINREKFAATLLHTNWGDYVEKVTSPNWRHRKTVFETLGTETTRLSKSLVMDSFNFPLELPDLTTPR